MEPIGIFTKLSAVGSALVLSLLLLLWAYSIVQDIARKRRNRRKLEAFREEGKRQWLKALERREEHLRQIMIPKANLVHGAYYQGTCRHAALARWDEKQQQFTHWRHKFGSVFVETIRHPEDDLVFDVFWPLKKVPVPEQEIPFKA